MTSHWALIQARNPPLPAGIVGRHRRDPPLEGLVQLLTTAQQSYCMKSYLDGSFTSKEHAESRGCSQSLLTRGNYHINAPFVHLDQLARDGTDTIQYHLIFSIHHLIANEIKVHAPASRGKLSLRQRQSIQCQIRQLVMRSAVWGRVIFRRNVPVEVST